MDILVKKINSTNLETSFYWKPASINIYINWNAHAPTKWKIGTVRKLIKQVKFIWSDESLQNEEMKYLTKVFHKLTAFECLL